MVLCRKNRPCGLKFSGGGGGGSGGCTGGQATAPVVSQQLPAGCGLQAHLAAKQGSNQRLSGSGLHEFHSLAGKQQSTANGNSEDCDDEAAMETAQLPNVGPTCVLPHLYIGSQADALDAEVMQRFGITHVINVSISCPQSQHVPDSNFLRIPVNDGYTDKLLPHFQRAFSFLERVRESSGRCLVHCLAGISRSPTLSIAYIMKHRCMSQDEAYRRSGGRGERPEAKRQRTSDRSPTSALSQLSFGVLPTVGSEIMVRRPRSVLIQGDGFVGGGISGPIWEQPVRRSRSSDAFLDLEDEAVRSCEETAVGPVACLS
uniref:protein-tyrosine-phosphatase n=1 Tax=Macrostomum lignano TaxID=282301 RepID=A0A1I8G2B8_9PLAT